MTPCWISALLDQDSFPQPFSLHRTFFLSFLFHFHSFSSTAIYSVVLFLPSSLFTNYFSVFFFLPFLCFLLFHTGFFSSLPVLLRHFFFCPSLPRFSTDRLRAPSKFHCYSCNMVFVWQIVAYDLIQQIFTALLVGCEIRQQLHNEERKGL
jgi:hypothetical protein